MFFAGPPNTFAVSDKLVTDITNYLAKLLMAGRG